jgi:hypothetical protein
MTGTTLLFLLAEESDSYRKLICVISQRMGESEDGDDFTEADALAGGAVDL